MPTDWSDERVEDLRRLYARGDSASVIAAAIGGGATRNAVIGKIHRLGLEPRGYRTVDAAERERRKQAERIRHANTQRIRRAAARGEAPPVLDLPPAPPPFAGSRSVPFADLGRDECKFIEGDAPDYHSCGNVTPEGASWCAHHQQIVWVKPEHRRATRPDAMRRGQKVSNFVGSFEAA